MSVAEHERQLWLLDQRINARGFRVDTELAERAIVACQQEKEALDRQVSEITMGTVDTATQRDRLMRFLQSYGVALEDMKAATLDKAMDRKDMAGEARQLIEARQRVSKASTAKFQRILGAVGPDNRLRGALQFAGASRTARWAGRIFQPHNLPRPQRKPDEIQEAVDALKAGVADLLTDNVHQLCSDVLRSLVVAEPGHQLFVADYSAIEARYLAWLAGEDWKLKVYRDPSRDLYEETYRTMFGLPAEASVSKEQRSVGKVFELSLGYEGGVGALMTGTVTYGVDPKELGEAAWQVADHTIREKAKSLYEFALQREDPVALEYSKKFYCQLEAAKLIWRRLSPQTGRLWRLYQEAAARALWYPGSMYKAGGCVFYKKGGFLIVRMPSGRCILYAKPKIFKEENRWVITYLGPYGGRQYLYGGKLAENLTQAGARDVLADAMLRLDKTGYPIVLHVHDEVVAEVADSSHLTHDGMCRMMEIPPRWAKSLPLAVEGYQAHRYRKE